MKTPFESTSFRNEEGLGLVEIMVSLFLLVLISVCFLPILVQGLYQASENATRASAVQLVNEQVELANGTAATCVNLEVLGVAPVADFTDSRNVTLRTTRTIAACPSSYPGVMRFTVSVMRTDTNKELANATTYLYVATAL